jgi:hypothetical protein
VAGDIRKMKRSIAGTPLDQLLPAALQRASDLEGKLRSAKELLSRHEESTAMLLLGLGRITQLIHDVAQPLAVREHSLEALRAKGPGPPRLRRVLDDLHSISTEHVTEEVASWEALISNGRAYKDACRLERSIYTELHDHVEGECLMQVHKSKAYETLYDDHKRELALLHSELQRMTAVVKNNSIVMRRKGRHSIEGLEDGGSSAVHSDEEPSALESASVPVPTPLMSTAEFDALKINIAALYREHREASESHRQHNVAFVEARRELERELARLQHQRREAAKVLREQEKSFVYFEGRVHGMDPNDKELPELLEACAREASTEASAESPDRQPKNTDAQQRGIEGEVDEEGVGYVSAFRRHAPKKLYISSRRTADDVRGPTIASIAREEASLETRLRADELRRY